MGKKGCNVKFVLNMNWDFIFFYCKKVFYIFFLEKEVFFYDSCC